MTLNNHIKPIMPSFGKEQIDLNSFYWSLKRIKLFIIYLPCASVKPYYLSSTHSYFRKAIKKFIPKYWIILIQICTISEVLGIVPEELETIIFNKENGNIKYYYYEHYPTSKENDIENTKKWMIDFISKYDKINHVSYITSNVFRDICKNIGNLKIFPRKFKQSSALFEFRKTKNIQELCNYIIDTYIKILEKRIYDWEKKKNQQYLLLKTFWNYKSFNIREVIDRIPSIKNPYTIISTLLREEGYGKGIFLTRIDQGNYTILPILKERGYKTNF